MWAVLLGAVLVLAGAAEPRDLFHAASRGAVGEVRVSVVRGGGVLPDGTISDRA